MKLEISNRLKRVADMVQCPIVADIGTDHGYVPVYLHKMKRITKAFACDINDGSLQKARDNTKLYGAEGIIESRLGDGLTPIKPYEAESAVISGMGGMLMIRILEDSIDVTRSLKELVLSPQRDIDKVRRFLHTIGFQIEREEMLMEDRKAYVIMRCIPGDEKYDREIDYLFGKRLLEQKNQVLKEHIEFERAKKERVLAGLKESGTQVALDRVNAVEADLAYMKEALACLQS